MSTYYDMGLRGAAESWRALRSRRASPPVPPKQPAARAATFRSSLEQAEQQFRAAAAVDYDSRALNLYYGLSQAGRAIAAAAPGLQRGEEWRLRGHGLTPPHIDQASSEDIGSLKLEPHKDEQTSFRRLSALLHSDVPAAFALGDVWPLMYETVLQAPLGSALYVPMRVLVRPGISPNGRAGAVNASVTLPGSVLEANAGRPDLGVFLGRYPALTGWDERLPSRHAVSWPVNRSNLDLRWDTTGQEVSGSAALAARLTLYRGREFAFPVLPGRAEPFHPLMVWFSVLYGLSMLTRYVPDHWTRLVDVNQCAQATAIEFVLDTALDAVPDLVDEAIAAVIA